MFEAMMAKVVSNEINEKPNQPEGLGPHERLNPGWPLMLMLAERLPTQDMSKGSEDRTARMAAWSMCVISCLTVVRLQESSFKHTRA